MQGTVKWFSHEKGYGFIVGDDGTDYYVHAKEIRGTTLPTNGAVVTFSPGSGRKGPAASAVELVTQGAGRIDRPDRMTCPHCNKQMVPRLVTYRGQPDRSFCPFCAAEIANYGSNWVLWLLGFMAVIAFLLFIVR